VIIASCPFAMHLSEEKGASSLQTSCSGRMKLGFLPYLFSRLSKRIFFSWTPVILSLV